MSMGRLTQPEWSPCRNLRSSFLRYVLHINLSEILSCLGGVGGRLNTTFGIVEDEAAAAGGPNATYTRLLDATFDLDQQQV